MLVNIKKFYTIQQAGEECMRRQLELDEVGIEIPAPPLPKYVKEKVKWSKTAKVAFISGIRSLIP